MEEIQNKKATELMFWKQRIQCSEVMHFADSQGTVNWDLCVNDMFKLLRHLLIDHQPECVFSRVTPYCIEFTRTYSRDSEYRFNGRLLEKTVSTFRGDPKYMGSISEYIKWWNSVRPVKGLDLKMDIDVKVPTYLPSLVICELGQGWLTEVDGKILEAYGFSDASLQKYVVEQLLRIRKRDFDTWTDFCVINEFWCDGLVPSLRDAVEELLYKK